MVLLLPATAAFILFGVHIDRYMVMTSNIIQFCINVNAFRFPVISTSIQSKQCFD